jgi:hypothetical protein
MTLAKATRHSASYGAGYREVPVREAWVGRLDGVAVPGLPEQQRQQITFLWTGGRVGLTIAANTPQGKPIDHRAHPALLADGLTACEYPELARQNLRRDPPW